MWFVMVIIVSACGSMGSGGSGCGVTSTTIDFPTLAACQAAQRQMFAGEWQPKREVICLSKEKP